MAEVLSKRGDVLLRGRMAGRNSCDRAERLAFAKFTGRLRAWLDLLLGSRVPGEEKDAVLRETLAEVVAGRSALSARLYDSAGALERELRCLLREHCEALMGGPGS